MVKAVHFTILDEIYKALDCQPKDMPEHKKKMESAKSLEWTVHYEVGQKCLQKIKLQSFYGQVVSGLSHILSIGIHPV